MDYNPLKLSIVPCAAAPESLGHSRTAFANISKSNCFPCFIVCWILNFVVQPTHENLENWYPTNKMYCAYWNDDELTQSVSVSQQEGVCKVTEFSLDTFLVSTMIESSMLYPSRQKKISPLTKYAG